MFWFLVFLAAAASAQYAANSPSDTAYPQQQAVQVQQVPFYGHPQHNQPMHANVRGGRNHGPFFDAMIDNYESHSSESSESRSREWNGRRHHRHHGNFYPSAHAWPYFGAQQPLSNPFYVPSRHHGRRHRHHRRHGRRHHSSSSEDRSD